MNAIKIPGNEPDANDMSVDVDPATGPQPPAETDADPTEEEEAAKLGDFA